MPLERHRLVTGHPLGTFIGKNVWRLSLSPGETNRAVRCMRTEVFTDQTAPHPAPFNKPSFDLSIAAFSDEGKVIGGVVGEILHDHRKEWPIRKGDPILEELERCYVEIVDMIKEGGFKGIERIGKVNPSSSSRMKFIPSEVVSRIPDSA